MKSIPTYKPVGNITVVRIFVLIIVVTPLLGTLLAIRLLWQFVVNWSDLVLLAAIYSVTLPGVTIGYHRIMRIWVGSSTAWLTPMCTAVTW